MREQDEFDCTLIRDEASHDIKKRSPNAKPKESAQTLAKPHTLTDREKAERLAGGSAQSRINSHIHRDQSLAYATASEARAVAASEDALHKEAQKKADKWYHEQIARDEEDKRRKISAAIEQKKPVSLLNVCALSKSL